MQYPIALRAHNPSDSQLASQFTKQKPVTRLRPRAHASSKRSTWFVRDNVYTKRPAAAPIPKKDLTISRTINPMHQLISLGSNFTYTLSYYPAARRTTDLKKLPTKEKEVPATLRLPYFASQCNIQQPTKQGLMQTNCKEQKYTKLISP
ncbi:hypothetical protein M758_12G190800 [Ceratodon purpureus]|nr:hypothetical protein M758_12G190800 [Ceratodon purpureus]